MIIGLMPFFETGFGILSTMRLIELSNPNHPLLRKILTETPGTYHHSVMVANLSEAACEAVGANGLLARSERIITISAKRNVRNILLKIR